MKFPLRLSAICPEWREKSDLTNFARPKSLTNRYRFNPHFLKWDFYCTNILLGKNGSNISYKLLNCLRNCIRCSTQWSIIIFNLESGKKRNWFRVPFFLFKTFVHQEKSEWVRRMKMSFSVINSIFNLLCTFLPS